MTDDELIEAVQRVVGIAPDMYDLLQGLREYFAERADAEYFTDSASPVPNDEMRFQMRIDQLLARVK